jgi:N-acetylneuraminic acid mutarotase
MKIFALSFFLPESQIAPRSGRMSFSPIAILCGFLLAFFTLAFSAGAQTTAPYEWTWMGGSETSNNGLAGVYGTLGTPAAGNIPGGRYTAASWTDSSGNFWLYGGLGFDASGDEGYLNDLWEFSPSTNKWTWMGGNNRVPGQSQGLPGVYGTLGTPAAGNNPGGRWVTTSWTDSSGNFWLFGGIGYDGGLFNDLWEFSPSTKEWAWMGGSNNYRQPGVYGTLGVPGAGNIPGSRDGASIWTAGSGHLWLFGGIGYDTKGTYGSLDDLWEFSPSTNEWAWMGGRKTAPAPGVYGTLGTPAAGNIPGGRGFAVNWTDSSGHLWLFGGGGLDANGTSGNLNDLWEFNPSTSEWAWMGGSSTVDPNNSQPGVYGTPGTPAVGNIPGGRNSAASWTDSSGHLWLFGGEGSVDGAPAFLDDFWEVNLSTNEWAWMGGSINSGQPGVYGTLGVPAAGNIPGSRVAAVGWTDSSGNLWLFGGEGLYDSGNEGLLNDLWEYQPAIAETPTFSVAAGTYITAQTVKLADSTSGATIYYTTNSTTPTASSAIYSKAITVSSSETIEAIAVAPGWANSAVASANYIITPPAATPVFSPAGGHYSSAQTVSISDATAGASIYYTVNNTAPTTASTPYTTPISVGNGETLEAVATAPGFSLSKTAVATYVLPAATPVFNPAGGVFSGPQTVTLTDATAGAAIYYTLNGVNPTTASTLYAGPIAVSTTETIKAMAIAPGDSQSSFAIADYALPAATPLIAPGSGTYPTPQTVTITDSTPGAVIYYTTSGLAPVPGKANTYVFSAPITISANETIETLVVAPGYANSPLVTATYVITPTTATPVITPTAGTYPAGQLVTLSDGTPGATIYFTTNGITPTTSSPTYTAPFLVGATQTVQAIAVESSFSNSEVSTTSYIIIGSPSALALPATAVNAPNATLNATVNSNGLAGTYSFQYGTSSSALTSSTAGTPLAATGLPVSASASLTGLASATTYYYQVVVTTAGGTASGAVLSFTTN